MTKARVVSDSNVVNFRNVLINGGFSIDQRFNGTARTIVAADTISNGYVVDRWYNYCTGANITGQRVVGVAPSQYYYRLTGATSNTGFGLGQRIEAANSFYLAGRVVTLSVNIASTSLTSITWTAFYANSTDTFGTLASPTRTQIATGTFTVSSTLSSKTATFTIPAAATTGIEIVFTGGALAASQTATFDDAQLEIGSSPTSFEQRPIGTELALCQRYYQTSFNPGQTAAHNTAGNGVIYHPGVSGGISGNLYTNLRFPQMRNFPTVSIFNGNNASATPSNGILSAGLNTTASGIRVYTAGGSGFDSINIGVDYIRLESISLYAQNASITTLAGLLAFGYTLGAEL